MAVLALATLCAMTTWFSATALLPQLRERWDLSTPTASLLTIAVQLGFTVGALASALGNVADLVPPRRLMLLGSLGAAAANAGLVAVDSVGPAVFLRFLTGAALALVYPPSLKAAATWFRRDRGRAFGVMVGALSLGSAAPHLLNAITKVGTDRVVIATSLLTVLGGVLAEVAGRDGPYPFPRTAFDRRRVATAFADRRVRLATAGYFGHMWELYAMWSWIAAFGADLFDSRQSASAAAFAVIGIGAPGCVAFGILADRRGKEQATIAAMATSGACAAAVGWLPTDLTPLVVGVACLWGFSVIGDSAQFSAVVSEVADQESVGTALTLQLAVGFTLTVVTIWLVPFVRDHAGWGPAFGVLALGPALGSLAMAALLRSRVTLDT